MSLNRFSVPRVMISRGTLFCGLLFPLSSLQIFFFFFFLFSLVASRATVVLGRNRIRAARQCLHVKLYMQKMDCVRYQNVGENKHSGICLLYVGGGGDISSMSLHQKYQETCQLGDVDSQIFFRYWCFLAPTPLMRPTLSHGLSTPTVSSRYSEFSSTSH